MSRDITQFDDIGFNQSIHVGKLRLAASGLGWKSSAPEHQTQNDSIKQENGKIKEENGQQKPKQGAESTAFTMPASDISRFVWSRASRGYELKVVSNKGLIAQFDNFEVDDLKSLESAIRRHYSLALDHVEHSLRGWNWGKFEFNGNELQFDVASRPAFEIPLDQISNSNLVGKNEVSVELNSKQSADPKRDELCEMRIFIPAQETANPENAETEEQDEDDDEEKAKELSNVQMFYNTLCERASIGESIGDFIVTFTDMFFVQPRGRYDIEMYPSFMRLRGKTYDYKVQFSTIFKLFLLPRPDGVHINLVIGLDQPLRQGQTRYPFLILQFGNETMELEELNVTDEEYEQKYKDKINKSYNDASYKVVSQIFKGLTGQRITTPTSFASHDNQSCVKCSYKANEGHLFPLDKCLMFIPKPPIYIVHADIGSVTFGRVGSTTTASRTFDLTVHLKGGNTEYQFANCNRDEKSILEAYFKAKGIKTHDEGFENPTDILRSALKDVSDDDGDDEDADMRDEDDSELSPDEDFEASSGSGSGSGSGSDDDSEAGDDDDEEEEEEEDDD